MPPGGVILGTTQLTQGCNAQAWEPPKPGCPRVCPSWAQRSYATVSIHLKITLPWGRCSKSSIGDVWILDGVVLFSVLLFASKVIKSHSSNCIAQLLLCTSASLVMCCDRFDLGSRQVKCDSVDLVTEDYDITLCWQIDSCISKYMMDYKISCCSQVGNCVRA